MPVPEDVRITVGLAVLGVLLLAIAVWWLWWRLPKREAARLALKIRDAKARADIEDNYRKTVGQALGGLAILLGTGSAYLQFSQQQRASHDLLISNQVSKGFEQLGSDKVVVRLGGIYALEGVMNTSTQYHQPVLEALSAFVREGAKMPATLPTPELLPTLAKPPTNIQAALTVIGRRSAGYGVVDLTAASIPGASLFGANLRDAFLRDANLLGGANLSYADLFGADLANANLGSANLTGANLHRADLTRALLPRANLTNANLVVANLTHALLPEANLTGANLTNADLTNAYLFNANLRDADLTGANLTGADLSSARVDQKQLDRACGSDAKLPTGLTLKPCPSQSSH